MKAKILSAGVAVCLILSGCDDDGSSSSNTPLIASKIPTYTVYRGSSINPVDISNFNPNVIANIIDENVGLIWGSVEQGFDSYLTKESRNTKVDCSAFGATLATQTYNVANDELLLKNTYKACSFDNKSSMDGHLNYEVKPLNDPTIKLALRAVGEISVSNFSGLGHDSFKKFDQLEAGFQSLTNKNVLSFVKLDMVVASKVTNNGWVTLSTNNQAVGYGDVNGDMKPITGKMYISSRGVTWTAEFTRNGYDGFELTSPTGATTSYEWANL